MSSLTVLIITECLQMSDESTLCLAGQGCVRVASMQRQYAVLYVGSHE